LDIEKVEGKEKEQDAQERAPQKIQVYVMRDNSPKTIVLIRLRVLRVLDFSSIRVLLGMDSIIEERAEK